MKKRFIVFFVFIFLFFSSLNLFVINVNATWWDSNWDYYKVITIDHDLIDSDLVNFPILVVIDDTTADKCKANGEDIVFVLPNNSTVLNHEIEKWVDNEDRIVWVNVTSISSTVDTKFLMYYGNVDASDSQNPTDVWNINFMAVWHMNGLLDSTINDIDLTNDGADGGENGKIGDCYKFIESNSDYMCHPTFLAVIPASDELTFETWAKHDTDSESETQYYLGKTNVVNYDRFGLGRHAVEEFLVFWGEAQNGGTDLVYGDVKLNIDIWYHCVGRYKANNALVCIQDGIDISSGMVIPTIQDGIATSFFIGTFTSLSSFMDGYIDEIRVSNIIRNDSWVKACFHSQNQTIGFITFGSEQTHDMGESPTLSNENPVNNTLNITLFPVLSITVNDQDGDNMIITWLSNVSGTWENIGYVLSNVYNGTYYQKFTEFAIYNLTYYWNVTVNDGYNTTVGNGTCFTAESIPTEPTGNEGEIGILGIFGVLGFLAYRRFRKNSGDKKE